MKKILIPMALSLLLAVGCEATPTEVTETTKPSLLDSPIPEGVTEFYTYQIGNKHYRITEENRDVLDAIMAKNGDPNSCWHWTHDNGDWFFRPCGMTLSESCYVIDTGAQLGFRECGDDNPGGDW